MTCETFYFLESITILDIGSCHLVLPYRGFEYFSKRLLLGFGVSQRSKQSLPTRQDMALGNVASLCPITIFQCLQ